MVILIDAAEAGMLTGYHALYIRKLMKKGDFPAAIYVKQGGRGRLHFQKHEVEAWAAARAAIKVAKRQAQAGMSAADARKAGLQDFTDAEAANDAATKALAAKAENRIRKALADAGGQVQS